MKGNKLVKFLIPLIAVVVVFESIVLVKNLDKNVEIDQVNTEIIEEIAEDPIMDFVFLTDTREMEVGKTYEVSLGVLPKEDRMIDGIETYIKYNVVGLKVEDLVSNKELQKPTLSEINVVDGLIKNIVLIDAKDGLALKTDELLPVITFQVTPQEVGEYELELTTSNENKEAASIVVENSTAKALPWAGSILEINVMK